MSGSSPDDLWRGFRIAPTRIENAILSRSAWVVAIVATPFLLLILESAAISAVKLGELDPAIVFQDLSDPIFTLISLALLLAGLVLVVRWRAQIEPAFRSLLEEKLVGGRPGENLNSAAFLAAYQRKLHSPGRFLSAAAIMLLILLLSLVVLEGRPANWNELLQTRQLGLESALRLAHLATRWALSAVLWGGFVGLALWVVAVTNSTIRSLTRRFRLQLLPAHPDRVGGLRRLGDLFSSLGLILLVSSIPLAIFGLSGTRDIVEGRACLDRLWFANRVVDPMDEGELVDCLTAINQAAFYSGYETGDARRAIQAVLAQGNTLDDVAQQMAEEFLNETYEGLPLSGLIMKRNRLPLFFLGGLAVVLIVGGYLILRPLWAVHRNMADQRERAAADLAREATALHASLGREVENHQWENAQATDERLELVQRLLKTAAAAPTWPISYPRVLRDYLLPALLSAGLSYGLTQLNNLLSPESQNLLELGINALGGG